MPHVKKEALKFLSTSSSLCYTPEGINDLKQRLEAKPKKILFNRDWPGENKLFKFEYSESNLVERTKSSCTTFGIVYHVNHVIHDSPQFLVLFLFS
jgi:hypothetical protein